MESAGEWIREARKAKGISIERLSAETRVHVDTLRAIEEDRYEIFPAAAYAVGHLRSCARVLGLDEEELLRRYRAEVGEKAEEEEQLWGNDVEEPREKRRSLLLPILGILAIALAAAAYLYLKRFRG
jgi:cytoskeleton protein RodZ